MKKPALWWALQFQFIFGIYSIAELLSLKLPMYSQYIQTNSSKDISVPNVWGYFHIYIARESATLTKTSRWCFNINMMRGNINIDVSPHILNLNSSSKILVLQWLFWFILVYLSFQVCQIFIHINTTQHFLKKNIS